MPRQPTYSLRTRPPMRPRDPLWQRVVAASAFGLVLLAGGALGYRIATRNDKPVPKPVEVAVSSTATPATDPTTRPEPPPPTKAEPTKKTAAPVPKPTKPEPEPEPEPPKPTPPPTKKPAPKSTPPTTAVAALTYDKLLPLLTARCLMCHGAKPRGGLDMRTLASLMKGGNGGSEVKPGKPDDSEIWKQIENDSMPPDGQVKLTPDEKKLIRDWILAGAK